jgi:hypothetical protein
MSGLLGSLYNSGPGWFNDIFTASLFFDADLEERGGFPTVGRVTNAAGEEETVVEYERALFAGGAPVQGFVRITAPAGRTVSHSGIHARIESGLVAVDEIVSRELHEEVVDVLPPGAITGTVDLPFVFPGTGKPLFESFEGDLFSVRHSVTVTISRPWYTFEVSQSKPFGVQRLHAIPQRAIVNTVAAENPAVAAAKDKAAAAAAAAAGGAGAALSPHMESQLAMYAEQAMAIPDAAGIGGEVTVRYNKACYEMSEALEGSIEFKGVTKPVVLIKLAVLRVETALSETNDTVIFDETVLDARRWKARKQAAAAEAAAAAHSLEAAAEEEGPRPGAAAAAALGLDEEAHAATGAGRTGPPPAAAAGDAGEGDVDEWMPSEADLTAEDPDPDLPVIGDVTLSLLLDWSQLDKLTPTYVIPLGADDGKPVSSKLTPLGEPLEADDDNTASVRYYVRVTVYTAFQADARAWNADEVVLFRDHLYGDPIPAARRPMADYLAATKRKTSSSSTGGASAPSVTALAAEATVPPAKLSTASGGGSAGGTGLKSPVLGGSDGAGMAVPSPRLGPAAVPPPLVAGGLRAASGSISGAPGAASSPLAAPLPSPNVPPLVRSASGRMVSSAVKPVPSPGRSGGAAGAPGSSPHFSASVSGPSPRLSPHSGPLSATGGLGRAVSGSVSLAGEREGEGDDMEDAESGMAGGAHVVAAMASAQPSPQDRAAAGVVRAASFSSAHSRGSTGGGV